MSETVTQVSETEHENKNLLRLFHGIRRCTKHTYLSGLYRYAGFPSGVEPSGGGICDGSGNCHKLQYYPVL